MLYKYACSHLVIIQLKVIHRKVKNLDNLFRLETVFKSLETDTKKYYQKNMSNMVPKL